MELFSSFASPSAACQDRAHSCVQVNVDASVCHCWSLDSALVDSNCSSGVMVLQGQRVCTPESAGRRYTRFAGKRGCLVRGLTVTQSMLARQG